jgi:hypothetical protein
MYAYNFQTVCASSNLKTDLESSRGPDPYPICINAPDVLKRLYLLIILHMGYITLTLTILDLLRIKFLSALRSYIFSLPYKISLPKFLMTRIDVFTSIKHNLFVHIKWEMISWFVLSPHHCLGDLVLVDRKLNDIQYKIMDPPKHDAPGYSNVWECETGPDSLSLEKRWFKTMKGSCYNI